MTAQLAGLCLCLILSMLTLTVLASDIGARSLHRKNSIQPPVAEEEGEGEIILIYYIHFIFSKFYSRYLKCVDIRVFIIIRNNYNNDYFKNNWRLAIRYLH